MKYLSSAWIIFFLIATSCNNKKKKEPEQTSQFISAYSLIRAQIKQVDTSLYSIVKIVRADTLPPDTSYIRREDFEKEAKEFLDIPDLGDKKIAPRFREEPVRYDEDLNRVMITYLPIDSVNEEYKSQELIITPNIATGDQVSNILIKRMVTNRDGYMQKNLLWVMGSSFQVTTITQKPGETEKVTNTRVVWNEEKTWSEENEALLESRRNAVEKKGTEEKQK